MKKNHSRWRQHDPGQAEEARRYEHPIPSREYLVSTLTELGQPVQLKALSRQLGLEQAQERRALEQRLKAMVRDGQLLKNRKNEYLITRRTALITGSVIGHRDGFGFLAPDDGGEDLFLPPAQMREVWHGDRVVARVAGTDGRGRREAEIAEVLERRTRQVGGRFHLEQGVGFVVPDNRRIGQRIVVPLKDRGSAKEGDLVIADILSGPSKSADALGRITRVLPVGNVAAAAIELAIASHGLPDAFAQPALREARRHGHEVPEAASAKRLDLRALPLVTIDGEDARDFDDAVYAARSRTGFRLIVAIADVAHYVTQDSALDQEARERATSVYFPGRVLPMLPEALSNELCSLKPSVDRLCLACDMHVSADGKVTRSGFATAVMRSSARLTYTTVADALSADAKALAAVGALLEPLQTLEAVYRALKKKRDARGALDFEAGEVKLLLDAKGAIEDIRLQPRNDAHRLIEECMIAANVEAARFLKRHGLPGLYRVHPQPDEERILELKRFLSTRGLALSTEGDVDSARIARLLTQVRGRPDAAMLESMIIRSLAQAVYQPENIGHFGLALAEYAHFTSPIRRYPDLLVHRAIHHVLRGSRAEDFPYSNAAVEALGRLCSARERRADEATRDVAAILKCEFMRDRIGEEFDGVVTGVTDFGLFVQLDRLQVDGLIHIANLGSDYFRFESDRRALVGERTRTLYTLGDKLRVRVTRVDPAERKIDFELAERVATAYHPRGSVIHPVRGRRRPRG